MVVKVTLPTFESRLDEIALAEWKDGWLCACEEDSRFLVISEELAESLAAALRSLFLQDDEILEVCAGNGELAESLNAAGVPVVATDVSPPVGTSVRAASANNALETYRPGVVLGSFVPVDAGVDELVLSFPSVEHYLVLGARIGGLFGSAALWETPSWTAKPLQEVARWMLTRHDVWMGAPETIIQHGEAWLFSRNGDQD